MAEIIKVEEKPAWEERLFSSQMSVNLYAYIYSIKNKVIESRTSWGRLL